MAKRRKGVTVQDVMMRFGISHNAAWRTIQRMKRRGMLFEVEGMRRKRVILYGDAKRASPGAKVYKYKPSMEDGDDE